MRNLITCATLAAIGLTSPHLRAQEYPVRAITIIVPFAAGSSTDTVARFLAERLNKELKQPVVVDNRPGGGGIVGTKEAAKAKPDGYTLIMGGISSHAILPALSPNADYSPVADFEPISLISTAPNIVAVHKSVPASNVQELLSWAKLQPGGASYASSGQGSSVHLAGELLRITSKAPFVHVPYKSASQAVSDLVAGHVPMMIYQIPALLPYIQNGSIRAIATTSSRRLAQLPNVPTLTEQGIDMNVSAWMALFGPAGLPKNVVNRIYAALAKVKQSQELVDSLHAQGLELVVSEPEAFKIFLAADVAKWKSVVSTAGIREK